MKIGIIGAGFTGLAAGFKLAKEGHEVTIFESSEFPGGLAHGFKEKKWKWTLEEHYHHLFRTDNAIQKLANEVKHTIIFRRPKTSTYYKEKISQIDSPINLLKFSHFSVIDKARTGFTLTYLKLTNSWQYLEKVEAHKFLKETMGERSWNILWKPLLQKKFGKYYKEIPASWFWARVKSRTAILGYPEGGFKELAKTIDQKIKANSGEIYYKTKVVSIKKQKGKLAIKTDNGKEAKFDRVICTLPTHIFTKITKGLSIKYVKNLKKFQGLGAINLVLILKKSFLKDGTYWLNINDWDIPFLCVVEHTNFMDNKKYSGERIIYIGNYLEQNHPFFDYDANYLLNEYLPHLKKLNAEFRKSDIKKKYVFKAPFAQPIVKKNFSKKIPAIKTPIDGLYLSNIQQVYPWDRGTNYAVELGNRVADLIIENK